MKRYEKIWPGGIKTLEQAELKALCFGLPQIWDSEGSFGLKDKNNMQCKETWFFWNLDLNVPFLSVIFSRDKIFDMERSMNLNISKRGNVWLKLEVAIEILRHHGKSSDLLNHGINYSRIVVMWRTTKFSIYNVCRQIDPRIIKYYSNGGCSKEKFLLERFFFDLFQIWIKYWAKKIKFNWDICFADALMHCR